MKQLASEFSMALDWMVNDSQVTDEQFAEALVHTRFESLFRLALACLDPGRISNDSRHEDRIRQPILDIILEAIARVVVQRDRFYTVRLSLNAWLARLVYLGCIAYMRRERLQRLFHMAGWIGERVADRAGPALSPLQKVIVKIGLRQRLAVLLLLTDNLTEIEVGRIFGASPDTIAFFLRDALWWIPSAVEIIPSPLHPIPGSKPRRTSPVSQILSEFYLPPQLSPKEQQVFIEKIKLRIQKTGSRRRFSIAAREMLLTIVFLAGIVITARSANILPTDLIHRYQTPTSFAKVARARLLPTASAHFYYIYQILPGDTLASVAQKAGVPASAILSLNQFQYGIGRGSKLTVGETLVLPANLDQDWQATPTPVVSSPPVTALTTQSDPLEIMRRIDNGVPGNSSIATWQTLWAEISEFQYGPPGYLGPPLRQSERQVWLSRPDLGMQISYQSIPPAFQQQFYRANIIFTQLGSGQTIQARFSGEIEKLIPSFRSIMKESQHLAIAGEGQVAGRAALILDTVDQYNNPQARAWIDAITGVILRYRLYSQNAPDFVASEFIIRKIVYDRDFPPFLFDPSANKMISFALDYSGAVQAIPNAELFIPNQNVELPTDTGHTPLAPVLAPLEFNPANEQIFLQWPGSGGGEVISTQTGESNGTPTPANPAPRQAGIGVYASHFYMGSLPLSNVHYNGCTRSADGKLIALRVRTRPDDDFSSQLYWFRVMAPFDVHMMFKLIYLGGPLAFSPDGHFLAFHACSGFLDCGIYLLSTDTDEITRLTSTNYSPDTFLWKPDGASLAVIAQNPDTGVFMLKVIDVSSGKVAYSGSFDVQTSSAAQDSPTRTWGIEIGRVDLAERGCMLP